MRNAMKKFVAVVLTLAMVLSMATVAFATPNFTGLNPATAVSLRIHHMRGMYVGGTYTYLSPGHPSIPMPPATMTPSANSGPVVGATWHAVRITLATNAGNINAAELSTIANYIINNVGTTPFGLVETSDVVNATTDAAGLATFSASALATAANGGNAQGQGIWFVWESELPGVTTGPHFENGERISNPHPPFLVNLPTFVHYDPSDVFHYETGLPGYWVYDVNVFPKAAASTPVGKTPGSEIPGMVGDYHSTTRGWTIEVGIPTAAVSVEAGSGDLIRNPLFHPINNPSGAALPTGLVGTQGNVDPIVNTYLLIRDILDYRTKLEGHPRAAGTAPNPGAPTTGAANAAALTAMMATMSVSVRDIVADTVLVAADNAPWLAAWQLVSHTFAAGETPPGGVAVPTGRTQQAFWIHFHQAALDILAPLSSNPNARIIITFNTVSYVSINDMTSAQVINNTFTFQGGRDETTNTGTTGNDGHRLFSLLLEKRNPTQQLLDGAVFHMFRADQVEWFDGTAVVPRGTAGANPRLIGGTQTPIRIATTGENTAMEQGVGQARFRDLPRGHYYIIEITAPSGYTAIAGLHHVYLCDGDCADVACTTGTVNVTQDLGGGVTVNLRIKRIEFTNTREFTLPLTGGAGTIMFTAAGVSLMGGAGLFLFLARKKEKTQK